MKSIIKICCKFSAILLLFEDNLRNNYLHYFIFLFEKFKIALQNKYTEVNYTVISTVSLILLKSIRNYL